MSLIEPPDQSPVSDQSPVARAANILRTADRVLVITGAGMSADSGLPTYRGIGGLYDGGATEDGMPIEDALSGTVFERDPALTWHYIAQIESACRGATPNEGHAVLARLQKHYERLCVLTQNVDGLHHAAGSRDVTAMHGDIHRLYCTRCGDTERVQDFSHIGALPPICEQCGGVVRPDVVLFGEQLPTQAIAQYETALAEQFDVIVAIGTTAVFPYIFEPVRNAAGSDTQTIEINPQATELSALCSVVVRLPAAQALMAIERDL